MCSSDLITAQYILGVVETKAETELNRDTLQKDIEAIYNQGFFSYVDVDLRPEGEGVSVTYAVRENPVIESISFTGKAPSYWFAAVAPPHRKPSLIFMLLPPL